VFSIISQVLWWDIRDLESRGSKIEKERGKDGKELLQILRDYPALPREDQERIRAQSQKNSLSIVAAIMKDKDMNSKLDDKQHDQALEYLAIQLSVRDRKEIINVFCHSNPDHFTKSVRELVDAYDPVIRGMHNSINLSGTVGDMEYFIRDMIKLGRIQTDSKGRSTVPTIGDFVMLLRKHQFSCHTFIHQACKNGPELTDWYLVWAKHAAAQFKRSAAGSEKERPVDAGNLNDDLQKLFSSLPEGKQKQILSILDAQIKYLDDMHAASRARLDAVLHSPPSKEKSIASIFLGDSSRPSSRAGSRASSPAPPRSGEQQSTHKDPSAPTPIVHADAGPGAFLSRWQDILDNTPISSHSQQGKPVKATNPDVVNASSKDVDGEKLAEFPAKEARGDQVKPDTKKPDVRVVVDCMAEDFRKLLAKKSLTW
jgi:hypothetical protein